MVFMEDEQYDDGDDLEEVYSGEGREDLVDNDEISPEEEAFMMGYDEEKEKKEESKEGDEAYEKAFEESQKKK